MSSRFTNQQITEDFRTASDSFWRAILGKSHTWRVRQAEELSDEFYGAQSQSIPFAKSFETFAEREEWVARRVSTARTKKAPQA